MYVFFVKIFKNYYSLNGTLGTNYVFIPITLFSLKAVIGTRSINRQPFVDRSDCIHTYRYARGI